MEEYGASSARTEFLLSSAHHTCGLPMESSGAEGGFSTGGFVATTSEWSGNLGVSSVDGSDAAELSDHNSGEPKQFTKCVLGAVSSDNDMGACRGASFLAAHGAHKPKP